MIEVLLFVCAASLLVFGSATLVFAALALRAARRYVNLAEERMELLRQGQARLLALPAGGRQVSEGGSATVRGLEELRDARRKIVLPAVAGPSEAHRGSRGPEGEGRENGVTPPTGFPETSTSRKHPAVSKPASDDPPRDARSPLGVRHPHPDDADLPARAPSRARSGAPVEMFRKHYDKYLENYWGYVELAERLYHARDDFGTRPPGSSEEHDREERLRRVNDGIARTIARLDILEELNPELAGDDRVSRRARVARRHAELAGGGGATGRS